MRVTSFVATFVMFVPLLPEFITVGPTEPGTAPGSGRAPGPLLDVRGTVDPVPVITGAMRRSQGSVHITVFDTFIISTALARILPGLIFIVEPIVVSTPERRTGTMGIVVTTVTVVAVILLDVETVARYPGETCHSARKLGVRKPWRQQNPARRAVSRPRKPTARPALGFLQHCALGRTLTFPVGLLQSLII
jgi:hypothetical protein